MDIMEKIGRNSIIQHGKFNDRIYLMKLSSEDYPDIIEDLEKISVKNNYSKIIAKIPKWSYEAFVNNKFIREAIIPQYFDSGTDLYFVSKFLDSNREINHKVNACNDVIRKALSKKISSSGDDNPKLSPEFSYKKLDKSHVNEIVGIYKIVFETYPFPIHDREYIIKTMLDNIIYFGIFYKDELVAVSSTEMDRSAGSVEMTDFSTLPEYRGNGFAGFLLHKMEKEMIKSKIFKSYTIARAMSFGMNITFAKANYEYGGRLINNTNISGNIESMNIWYKNLKDK